MLGSSAATASTQYVGSRTNLGGVDGALPNQHAAGGQAAHHGAKAGADIGNRAAVGACARKKVFCTEQP